MSWGHPAPWGAIPPSRPLAGLARAIVPELGFPQPFAIGGLSPALLCRNCGPWSCPPWETPLAPSDCPKLGVQSPRCPLAAPWGCGRSGAARRRGGAVPDAGGRWVWVPHAGRDPAAVSSPWAGWQAPAAAAHTAHCSAAARPEGLPPSRPGDDRGNPGAGSPFPSQPGTAAPVSGQAPPPRTQQGRSGHVPPRPPWLLASTHLAGTLLLRSDLTARPRQPGTAGSVVVGVPQQHPGRAGGCGHAGGPGCSLEAWGPQGRWARWGPRASSGQDRGGRREPGRRPRQRRGPGATFPFPFSPRRRGEAGGGALPEPHGGLEEEPLPRQQLRASFTPENGVQSCCHSPTARGTAQDPHSSHVSIGSRSPSSGRTPVSLHLHAATPSKGRDGDETTPKCWGTTGQVGTCRALSLSCSGLVVALFTPQLCPRATLNM